MAGIYIHIPFCRHKCNYCNFYSLASTRNIDRISSSIALELIQRKVFLQNQTVETIYFGGGTPSLLHSSEIENIIATIYANYSVADIAEITLEANPDDISNAKLEAWKQARVNRLSIGIQSFMQNDLDFLSRTHTSEQVTRCIADTKDAGFDNLSIDLIYGIPTLTNDKWIENLEKAFELKIPHISAYSLTVEEKTPLEVLIRKGKINPVDEELSASHYHILCAMMREHGYEHYEVSNFCLPGAYSKHNTAYWQGKPYLGVGPSAHSFSENVRCWNVSNLNEYIESVQQGEVKAGIENLTLTDRFNEYIMTSLRTMWGCDLVKVKTEFGMDVAEDLLLNATGYLEKNQMVYNKGNLVLTSEGLLFADGISSALFREHQ